MKKVIFAICLAASFLANAAGQGNIQQECTLRASWVSDIVGLYNNPVRQCTKQQVKTFIYEASNGGVKTLNNCIQRTGDKLPSTVDSKKFALWGDAVTDNVWNNTLRDPGDSGASIFQDFATACMNNPDMFIGNLWLYK